MDSFGQRLRAARESRDGKLVEIADELRISSRYLEALEADNLDRLPGQFFTRAFLRQYAEYLGIDEAAIRAELARLPEEDQEPAPVAKESGIAASELAPLLAYAAKPRRQHRRIITGVAALLLAVLACALAYRYWLMPTEPAPARITIAGGEKPASTPNSPPTVVEPTATPRARQAGPLWLQIEAEAEVWVEITSGDERLFTGILQPSETKELAGLSEARLLIGNAGGLRIYSNGKSVGPIGESGQVRVVTLTPEGAEIRTLRETDPRPAGENDSSTG